MGHVGTSTAFQTHRTTLYVIYFQAPVGAIATIGIFMSVLDALLDPTLAHLADVGKVNDLPCFPMAKWG
eukprot:CAMPEP_0174748658 /NCGR_PEP_ID=MMETSP1094-20130205/93983_1 /TAXON_ID=156173 /ORGANISM="Chrysochromulina brevifilum, Strain UTEX LB 985" /LENGTH=68 /DNA_ID=CAMNT_0015953739 /DNA_START=84 /DNA_END=286 /DNA_ORIENTATION=+